jgi:hypothetical protein
VCKWRDSVSNDTSLPSESFAQQLQTATKRCSINKLCAVRVAHCVLCIATNHSSLTQTAALRSPALLCMLSAAAVWVDIAQMLLSCHTARCSKQCILPDASIL